MGMAGRLGKEALPKRRSQIGDAFVRPDACVFERRRAANFRLPSHAAIPLLSMLVSDPCRHCRKSLSLWQAPHNPHRVALAARGFVQ